MEPESTGAREVTTPPIVEEPLDAVRRAFPPLLEPGETLREVTRVSCAFGDTGDVDQEEPPELKTFGWFDRAWSFATRTTPRKVVFTILLSPILLYLALESMGGPGTWLDRLIGGRTLAGSRGSLARQAQHALSALGPHADVLAVTDRRMILAPSHVSEPEVREITWSTPLVNVTDAARRPRGLTRKRVKVTFSDGSWIVLAQPLIGSPKSTAVAAALHAAYLPPRS